MTWYRDLSQCTYFHLGPKDNLKAIGWLEHGHPFHTGQLEPEVREQLSLFIHNAPIVARYRGYHDCDFCPIASSELGHPDSDANYFVPGAGTVYAIPGLIGHYIDKHHYLPPDEFREALMGCPLDPEAYATAVGTLEPALLKYR